MPTETTTSAKTERKKPSLWSMVWSIFPFGVEPDEHERMVYWARSDDPNEPPYRVELAAENGMGKCACKRWETSTNPERQLGVKVGCKHLIRCWAHFGFTLAHQIAKETKRK